MKIKTVTYRRTKNLGNYQSETLEATAEVEEEDLAGEAYLELRVWVLANLGIPVKPDSTQEDEDIPY